MCVDVTPDREILIVLWLGYTTVRRAAALLIGLLVITSLSGCITDGGEGSGSRATGPEDHGGIEFMTDYDAAEQRALDQDKPLLVYFWADWCTWCDRYHENVFPDQGVRDAADGYVRVAVDVDGDSSLVDEHGVRGPPVMVLVDPETGEAIHRLGGYPNPDAVEDPASYVADVLNSGLDYYHRSA